MGFAVLLVAHGTVEDLAEIPAFLRTVRRGRDASPELIEEMHRRYEAIGGSSPLLSITESLARKLAARIGAPVRVGMRLWRPFLRDVLSALVLEGSREITVLPLAQHSTHVYNDAVKGAAAELVREGAGDLHMRYVGPWGATPELLKAQIARIRRALEPDMAVILTAHSLPKSVIAAGDPYEREFLTSVDQIRRELTGVAVSHAFQSQGADGGDWLGPDLTSALTSVKDAGFKSVLVAPVGFLADHLEILYDLDIEARAQAVSLGLRLVRSASLNDDDDFVGVLEGLVRA